MKLALSKCGQLELVEQDQPQITDDNHIVLKVLYCAVCRTDAKMWRQGHRDLELPRVLGHEIVGLDERTGYYYTLWPGQSCGECLYCNMGRENLCEEMKIIGFHSDGGFASHVVVPKNCLVPVKHDMAMAFVTFAEPVACVINGLSGVSFVSQQKALVMGGGVVGMLAALLLANNNCTVTVIEKSQEKIARMAEFCRENSITLCKETVDGDFDLAINCCDSYIGFCQCVTKIRKGGRLSFFSGLEKNEEIDTNLLNLIHYKELEVCGAYGPRYEHMVQALSFCSKHARALDGLIEGIINLDEVEEVLPKILSGESLKFIVDCDADKNTNRAPALDCQKDANEISTDLEKLSSYLEKIIQKIKPVSKEITNSAQKKVDLKIKPLGALGRIENLAVQLSVIQKDLKPAIRNKRMFVFAGDHGVVEEGVSAFPAKVTVQMVENFLDGGAAINVFCRQYDIDLAVVDMGVKGDFPDHQLLIKKKVARGTKNFAVQRAMSIEQAIEAVEKGAETFLLSNREKKCDVVGMGEMGIGNTSCASALICAVTGLTVDEITGRGTGVDDSGLKRKKEVLSKALGLHQPDKSNALELLSTLGGYELAGICGAVLAAVSEGCCVVLDGIISTAAGLLAYLVCPDISEYLVAGHKSVELGQKAALDFMGLEPVLDLDMRLGEGTGAAITIDLVELACSMMREMASFEEAGVDSGSL